ncbi:MAG: FAD binding domain-containing protein [Bradymonadales bacterium]|nr:FAD binding domain-containing protein [Bradymonadales bacterium]
MASHFHQPERIEEALRFKQELGEAAYFLAGGTEVNNSKSKAAQAEHLIWLGKLGLGGIKRREGGVSIGAMTTLQEMLESELLHPAIHQAARNHANRNIRNVATIGGHLATCRSCADVIPVLLALRAWLRVATLSGELERDIERWLLGERDGIVLSVEVPDPPADLRVALECHTRTANDVSLITAGVSLRNEQGCMRDLIVAAGGVAASVVRLHEVEAALEGKPLPSREEVESLVAGQVNPIADIRGSADFKRHLAATLVERALRKAWNR